MRHSGLLFVGLSSALAALGACSSDGGATVADAGNLDAGAPDAQSSTTSDAQTDASSADAAPVDASPDGSAAIDASPTCATSITRTGSRAVAYQIDPAHTGWQPNDALALPLCERWRHDFGEAPSYPIVADGRVIVASSRIPSTAANITALDATTGAIVWGPIAFLGTKGWATLAHENGKVFALNNDGKLRAMDATNGSTLWEVTLPNQSVFTSPPTAAGGNVFTSGTGTGNVGTLYAIDQSAGAVAWSHSIAGGSHSAPVVDSVSVFASYGCNWAYRFAPSDGTYFWEHNGACAASGGKTAMTLENNLYTRDSTGNLVISTQTGEARSMYASSLIPAAAQVTNAGYLILTTSQAGVVSATPIAGGQAAWTFGPSSEPVVIAPIVVGQHVVIGTSKRVVVVALDDGHEVSSVALTGIPTPDEDNVSELAGIAAADGMLFVPSGNAIVAF
jgi:outer membrane protein assembly factor BamB